MMMNIVVGVVFGCRNCIQKFILGFTVDEMKHKQKIMIDFTFMFITVVII